MEHWTGIISGTNRGLVSLNFETLKENQISGTLQLFDPENINLSAKVDGHVNGNVLQAKIFDFTPRQEGVPTEGEVALTISEDQKEMKGQWRTNIDTQGECVLYRFSTAGKPPSGEQPALTLETKTISISFCSFNKKDIEDIINIMTSIVTSIRQDKENAVLPPIYSITYDQEEQIKTYSRDEFFAKFGQANKIGHIGFELRASNNPKSILINLYHQQNVLSSPKSSVFVADTEKEMVTMIPEMVRGLVSKAKNRRFFYHHWLFEAIVQIFGVSTMIVVALIASQKLALSLENRLENASVYIFVVILITLSNFWTYSFRLILNTIYKTFPVVEINNRPKAKTMHKLVLGIIATIFGAAFVYGINKLWTLLF